MRVAPSRTMALSRGASSQSPGEKIADGIYIEAAAGDVLGARVIAALEDDDLDALTGQRVRRRQPGQSRPAMMTSNFSIASPLLTCAMNRFLTYPFSLAKCNPKAAGMTGDLRPVCFLQN